MRVLLYSNNYMLMPKWWDNFLDEHRGLKINDSLMPYGGRYSLTFDEGGFINERWLEFERDADYTWFILRFSS